MDIQVPRRGTSDRLRFLQNGRIRCRVSSPFHILLCSSRICRFRIASRIRANPSRNTKCQPIQLSKNFVSQATEPSHSRWGVRFLIFEDYSKGRETIKNPASSAGPSRPLLPRDGFARCSTICYPEFVTYLTFGLVFRNSRLPLTTLQTYCKTAIRQSNREYSRIFCFVKGWFKLFVRKP
jgi:hypothetical protein